MDKGRFPDVSLRDIWSFQVMCEEGSVTAAAQRLGITQAALSRRLQRLEARLGFALFEREGGRLLLGRVGEEFAQYAAQATSTFGVAMQKLHGTSKLISGQLRVISSAAPGEFLVPYWTRRFLGDYPACVPHTSVSNSDRVLEEVLDGNWDVGFLAKKPESDSLRSYPVAEDEVVLAVPADHPFAARGVVDLDDLAGETFVDREGRAETARLVDRVLAERGLSLPGSRRELTVNSGPAMVASLERGRGLSWLSVENIDRPREVAIAAVRIRGIEFRRHLYMVHLRRPLPPVADTFVRWLLAEISGVPVAAEAVRPTGVRRGRRIKGNTGTQEDSW